jgi:hypothetical protein
VHEGDLARLALRVAADTFENRVTELVEAAGGDVGTLYRAAISMTTPAAPPGTPQHVAFTYLVAAAAEAKRRGSGLQERQTG